MITIHIDPTETQTCDDDRIIEPAKNPQTVLTRAILGIVLILAVIIISLLSACSGTEAPATYHYIVPVQLDDG